MKRTKKDYHRVLQETVDYYSEDVNRRAVNKDGVCFYYNSGKMCAIGRQLIHPEEMKGFIGNVFSLSTKFDIEQILKEKYRCFRDDFRSILQGLHDYELFWDENGLTSEGLEKVQEIKKFIESEIED